jgi:hypothetical protein
MNFVWSYPNFAIISQIKNLFIINNKYSIDIYNLYINITRNIIKNKYHMAVARSLNSIS